MMGQINPQLLQMLLSQQGGQRPNAAPQIPVQPRPQSMAPIVQAPPSPGNGQGGGGIGSAVNAGGNVEKLYNMGNNAYNWGAKQFGSPPPQPGMQTTGAPVAQNPMGQSYLNQNPQFAGGTQAGTTPTGFVGPGSGPTSGMAYQGSSSPSGMFGSMSANGTPLTSQSGLFGAAGASGGTGATGASAANSGAAATGSEAADSSPSWLQSIWAYL